MRYTKCLLSLLLLSGPISTTAVESNHPKRIKLVILDNSGTTNDCGVYAPAVVFIQLFDKYGIKIEMEEARQPMGLFKKDHIRAILSMKRVIQEFECIYGRGWTEDDVEMMFADFVSMEMNCLEEYCDLIPGTAETIAYLRKQYDVLIGSTTGFNKEMNDLLLQKAAEQGYFPDVYTSASEVPKARPHWYMVQSNMLQSAVLDPHEVLKVGDTRGDMQEGKAMKAVDYSGTWTLGLAGTGNYVGKNWQELQKTSGDKMQAEMQKAETILYEAGADYVVPNINSLPTIIDLINDRLSKGESPREISLDYLNLNILQDDSKTDADGRKGSLRHATPSV